MGAGMGNFREIARDLLGRGAARSVADAADLGRAAAGLLGDPNARASLSEAASGWRRENGGGVGRTLAAIREALGNAP
jgi:3-deoxy-D-manno-octulosonic-acid transferase